MKVFSLSWQSFREERRNSLLQPATTPVIFFWLVHLQQSCSPESGVFLCMCIHCGPACFVVCSTKTCPTTRWTGWASRPPCTETRTAPGPCRRCTSTTGPSCTLTSTRTPPTPTPCLPVWAPPLTTLSREIKTLYTGRCKPPVRAVGKTLWQRGSRGSRPGGSSRGGL